METFPNLQDANTKHLMHYNVGNVEGVEFQVCLTMKLI
jgi:hypothetical protein